MWERMNVIVITLLGLVSVVRGFVSICRPTKLPSSSSSSSSSLLSGDALNRFESSRRPLFVTNLPASIVDPAYEEMSRVIRAAPKLPPLTKRDKFLLASGERVQMQHRDGRSGRGVVVVDIKAPPEQIFAVLTSFEKYDTIIPTVRSVKVYSSSECSNAAEFALSKFRLKVNVVHTFNPEDKTIKFSLDPSRPNFVMRVAEGFWHIETPKDRPEGYSRVWLSANIVASRLLPPLLVDYAAGRALPRATSWLQTFFSD